MECPFVMITESDIEKWRYSTLYTKEPETIAWIQSFMDGEIFYDIGANIGIYSLYCASIHPLCRIFSFEPSRLNFNRLNENIELNGFDKIETFQYAIGNSSGFILLDDCVKTPGETGSHIANGLTKVINTRSVQARTIDCMCEPFDISHMFPIPNHIKIDIDGQEGKVIDGMRETLKCDRLKSVLIEVGFETPESYAIANIFNENGFTMNNSFNCMEDHSRKRRKDEKILVENVVFTRY